MRNMLAGNNLAISLVRSTEIMGGYEHVFVSNLPTTHHTVSIKEVNYHFPLWLRASDGLKPNFSQTWIVTLQSALNLSPTAPLHAEKIFHYLYAILHSPTYRTRYAAFLRTDFPRIPIPGSFGVFDALAKAGAELVQWHLLEHPDAIKLVATNASGTGVTAWFGTDYSLTKVAEKSRALADLSGDVGKVFVNATSGFAHVSLAVWQHTIGGYQVLHKWLDDRRKAGRSLSTDDILHWQRVYAALQATQTLMPKIDACIDAHGGWPNAFSQNHPPPDATTQAVEQKTQQAQRKAHQKANANTTKTIAANAVPMRPRGLFDPEDDLNAMAAAAGAPPRKI